MNPTTPICPKCGYDQSGEIATWETQCPLEGRCPECGLDFAWCDVFDPVLNDLYWYSEHARSIWGMIWCTPRTLWMLALPHGFWREVDVVKRVSVFRLFAWALIIVAAMHLLVAILNGYVAWTQHNWSSRSWTLAQYLQEYRGHGVAEIIFDGFAYPYFNAVPQAYSSKWSLYITPGWSGAWYEYLIKPLVFETGFIMLWLIVLLAIPQSRRIAQIRSAHMIRAMILSVMILVLTYELTWLNRLVYELTINKMYWQLSRVVVPAAVIWQLVFWASAIGIGWRVRPWKLLVTLGTVAALLGGLALSIYVFLGSIS